MSKQSVFLVLGATGQQGGAVVNSLLSRGMKVRALVRDSQSDAAKVLAEKGAELAVGDLCNKASLISAMDGVSGVFAMTHFIEGPEVEMRQGKTVADAANESGVQHLVFSSVACADAGTGIPHFESKWAVEQYIEQLGLPATVFRPAWFMDNFYTYFAPADNGTVIMPLPGSCSLDLVAVQDIGEMVAEALINPESYIGVSLDLASDTLTLKEAIEILSKRRGVVLQHVEVPVDDIISMLGESVAAMFRWQGEGGHPLNITELKKQYPFKLVSFEEFVAQRG